MSASPARYIDLFASQRVLVIGEAMLDAYLSGTSDRLCQEAPVPVVRIREREYLPGGAANVARNVVDLGGRAHLLSVVGDDEEGATLRGCLAGFGISCDGVVVAPQRHTLAKQRVLASGQLVVRFDQGTELDVPTSIEDALRAALQRAWASCDAVVLSDYGYGVITPRLLREVRDLQSTSQRLVVVDAKELVRYADVGVTAVKPNYQQAITFLPAEGRRGDRADVAMRAADAVLASTRAQIAAVTLDADGAVVVERDRPPYRTYARPRSDARAAGAGDTFVGALTLALAAGAHTPAAAELASRAAGGVVAKDRTASCSLLELRESFSAAGKVLPRERLAQRAEFLRRRGRRIVFTNGCFDILHRGHITYLSRAKMLGDVLIVGVNSDEGVARLKGPSRPVNPLEDRVEVLAALSSVDHVVSFDEDTPERLIELIKPQVFVKGGDYTVAMLPEAGAVEANGGAVHILPYVEDRSTTGIIDRIRAVGAESEVAG
ncbi:MAG TPA: D-glycero-beta-D-manno-heptose 1-phosphate adenylyltransferase [Actinomycetota bacterium]|nr:D-glycero-beta-D-manno-heptose 1-phosphate adenylyltransferase [Actinomycetota bacterium]